MSLLDLAWTEERKSKSTSKPLIWFCSLFPLLRWSQCCSVLCYWGHNLLICILNASLHSLLALFLLALLLLTLFLLTPPYWHYHNFGCCGGGNCRPAKMQPSGPTEPSPFPWAGYSGSRNLTIIDIAFVLKLLLEQRVSFFLMSCSHVNGSWIFWGGPQTSFWPPNNACATPQACTWAVPMTWVLMLLAMSRFSSFMRSWSIKIIGSLVHNSSDMPSSVATPW